VKTVFHKRALALVFGCALVGCNASDKTGSEVTPDKLQINGDKIVRPLSVQKGNAQRGRVLFTQREAGHCVLCHQVDGLDIAFQGGVGPDLSQIGARFSAQQLRLRIVDYSQIKPDALMPSYYKSAGLHQVEGRYAGKTVLSAQEIEDIIAYLLTLGSDNLSSDNLSSDNLGFGAK